MLTMNIVCKIIMDRLQFGDGCLKARKFPSSLFELGKMPSDILSGSMVP